MTHAFGSDWKSLFDLSIVYAQKPGPFPASARVTGSHSSHALPPGRVQEEGLPAPRAGGCGADPPPLPPPPNNRPSPPAFFEESRPFAVIDEVTCREARWLEGGETPSLAPPGSAADAPVYAYGNLADVRPLLGDRVVYFGDHLVGDIRAARAVGWSTVAVVEEAQEVAQHAVAVRGLQGPAPPAAGSGEEGGPGVPAPPNTAWGSFYLAGHGDTPREAASGADAEQPPSRLTLGAIMALEHSDFVVQDVADIIGSA